CSGSNPEKPMDDRVIKVVERCLHGAEDNSMTFPQVVGDLNAGRLRSLRHRLPSSDRDILPARRGQHRPADASPRLRIPTQSGHRLNEAAIAAEAEASGGSAGWSEGPPA